eukprot:c3705_g1_i2 orf=463-711(-)
MRNETSSAVPQKTQRSSKALGLELETSWIRSSSQHTFLLISPIQVGHKNQLFPWINMRRHTCKQCSTSILQHGYFPQGKTAA